MGRWESTKTIRPFQGVYLYGNDRVAELEKKKREEKLNNDIADMTVTDVQNICDYYGIPVEFVKQKPKSFAELLFTDDRLAYNYDITFYTDDEELVDWVVGYDPNKGLSKQEYIKEMKKALPRRGMQSDSQLIKVAEQCGVKWDYADNGELQFNDDRFTLICSTVLYAKEKELYHLSPTQQRKLIKEKYTEIFRDPGLNGAYELCKSIILNHYNIEVTENDDGKPIGKYAKFLNNFNNVYDGFMREGRMPALEDVIGAMDEILRQTEMEEEAKRARANKKRSDTRRRNKYFKDHPVKKRLYNLGVNLGYDFETDEKGAPHIIF